MTQTKPRSNWQFGTIEDYWKSKVAEAQRTLQRSPPRSEPDIFGPPPLSRDLRVDPLPGSVDWLIKHLECPRENVRLNVAQSLKERGPSLSEAEVGKIVALLNNTNFKYRLSPNKLLYDVAPVNYYAAKALSGMNSKYLSASVRQTANGLISRFNTPHYTQFTTSSILKEAEA